VSLALPKTAPTSVPVLTFFNNKGGVGKTSLVFHLAWMFAERGRRVVTIDLDPQANLTSAFLPEESLEALWDPPAPPEDGTTIFRCIQPLTRVGDILKPLTQAIHPRLHLVPGDLALAGFEDQLSGAWTDAMGSNQNNLYRPFRLLTAFWQVAQMAAQQHEAEIILADVGPNLGAINRSALIGSDHVVIPVAADLFSLQGLRNLGPTLTAWRTDWHKRVRNWDAPDFRLPTGGMRPEGYILMQHMERLSRPVRAYQKWVDRIPSTYLESVVNPIGAMPGAVHEGHCLARLKHYRSLVPMAQEARKPIFHLSSADGAIGSHGQAVRDAWSDFHDLATKIEQRLGLSAESPSLDDLFSSAV
jgi:chromosome partitioning protein